ncbi:MAG TPA: hypothetical protein DD379_02535 [Cyanobacteria bacterium UBA11162]|nr:hypothetical protein [Cyanobacteria bacterium UBA11162]
MTFKQGKNVLRQRECPKLIRRALMPFLKRYFILLTMTTTITGLITSCAEGKISQCNKIIRIANNAVSEANSITNGGQTSDPKVALKMADTMQKASQSMKSLKVKDEKLEDYQAGFINMYSNSSKAMRNFVAAYDKKDRTAAEVALANVQQAATQYQQLVDDLNSYCASQ